MAGATREMLQSCLQLNVKLRTRNGELLVEVEALATNVGHRVPTGFIDRHLILVVEALNAKGERLPASAGPRLPDFAGVGDPAQGNFAGLSGRLFGKQIEGIGGQRPVPFWRPNRDVADTRLEPGKPVSDRWVFPAQDMRRVRVRLIYRRFYVAVINQKQWPHSELAVTDRLLDVP